MNRDKFMNELFSKATYSDEDKNSIKKHCRTLEKHWRQYFFLLQKMGSEHDDYTAFRNKEEQIYSDLLQKLETTDKSDILRKYIATQILTIQNLANKVQQDKRAAEWNLFQQYRELEDAIAIYVKQMQEIVSGEINVGGLVKIVAKWRDRYSNKATILEKITNRNKFLKFKEAIKTRNDFNELVINLIPEKSNASTIKGIFDDPDTIAYIIKGFIEYVDITMPVVSDLHNSCGNLDEDLKTINKSFGVIPNCCAIEILNYLAIHDLLDEKVDQKGTRWRDFVNSKGKLVIVPNKLMEQLHDIIFTVVAPDYDKMLDQASKKIETVKSLLRSNVSIESVSALTSYENYRLGLI